MKLMTRTLIVIILVAGAIFFVGCATTSHHRLGNSSDSPNLFSSYASRLPQSIETRGEKVVMVDPSVHAWGAYDSNGNLLRAGLAVAGSDWCNDLGRPCRTSVGTFRIQSLGSADCKSSIYPKPKGGAPMPYCMFFRGNQALHGSPPVALVDDNVSHGCVRMSVSDAEWLRFNFATIGTKVIVRSY